MTEDLWHPSQDRIEGTRLHAFAAHADQADADYDALWRWSLDAPEAFWQGVWDFCGVIGTRGDGPALDPGASLKDARFFPSARVNFAENLLRRTGSGPAVIGYLENGDRRVLSWDDLHDQVARTAKALKAMGVSQGDRCAGFMPNIPETVIAMLATAALGGIWSSCSPDFGVTGVLDRFGQIEPKVLFTADGYFYNGKTFDSLSTVAELRAHMPSVTAVVVVPLTGRALDLEPLGKNAHTLPALMDAQNSDGFAYTPVGFNDPLFIMFSSGTTGVPKCIVHRTGGVLLQHLKEHQLQCDVKPGDRMLYFTTCGWMMWNWLVSALASEATIVLYDGSPFHPDGNRLPDIAARENVTHFGTSAKYLDACAKHGIKPAATHDLSALRTLLSTGSPLSPEGFDAVYRDWKADLCLSSIAGGTDIIGCFVGGNPIGPVWRGECQKRHLGMAVQAFNDDGEAVLDEPGELVCTAPHPSMPWGFWNDPDGAKYSAAYFETYPGVWHHGDLIVVTEHGGVVFLGRSDATLNPGGVRIGTAEIYRQVEKIPEVLDSIVVGQHWDGDERIVLFVKLRDGVDLDDALIARIKRDIRTNCTPRHTPAKVLSVTDIPRTKSGKIVELAVRNVLHDRPVKNIHALANPESLELFKDRPELAD